MLKQVEDQLEMGSLKVGTAETQRVQGFPTSHCSQLDHESLGVLVPQLAR